MMQRMTDCKFDFSSIFPDAWPCFADKATNIEAATISISIASAAAPTLEAKVITMMNSIKHESEDEESRSLLGDSLVNRVN